MSRHGYSDYCDDEWRQIMWRGAVASAIRGKRGQAFLKEAIAVLDALPEKKLISTNFQADGNFCTLGAVAHARNIDVADVTEERYEYDVGIVIAKRLNIATALAREIMYMNDEGTWAAESPESRFRYMHKWLENKII
jgi:hypothetical protein